MPGRVRRLKAELGSDRAIARAARQILGSPTMLRCSHLRLNVADGWITLDGDVRDRAAWDELVRAIAGVDGVKGVDDRAAGRVVKRVRLHVRAHSDRDVSNHA
jgi:osmotically-inducible protein OsmY